jgi:peptidoglycan hydrolase-like protein with peptidoglycan-binding domain
MEVVAKGSKGETVKVLQKILKDMGYYTDDIDGKAGGHTVKAIKAIQTAWHKKDSSILVDGSFGPQCWTKMMEG